MRTLLIKIIFIELLGVISDQLEFPKLIRVNFNSSCIDISTTILAKDLSIKVLFLMYIMTSYGITIKNTKAPSQSSLMPVKGRNIGLFRREIFLITYLRKSIMIKNTYRNSMCKRYSINKQIKSKKLMRSS